MTRYVLALVLAFSLSGCWKKTEQHPTESLAAAPVSGPPPGQAATPQGNGRPKLAPIAGQVSRGNGIMLQGGVGIITSPIGTVKQVPQKKKP